MVNKKNVDSIKVSKNIHYKLILKYYSLYEYTPCTERIYLMMLCEQKQDTRMIEIRYI